MSATIASSPPVTPATPASASPPDTVFRQSHWLLACRSAELPADKPLGVELHGKRYALFRSGGDVVALDDDCPHRHAQLSGGAVRDGCIACPYHGVRFDKQGRCAGVPSLIPGKALPKYRMGVYASYEAEGFVWIYSTPDRKVDPPAYWPVVDERYASFLVVTDFRSTPELLVENFVDCSHTNFVHGGDFRGEPANTVRAVITDTPTGVLVRTIGETRQDSLLSKLLIGSQTEIEHTDELILPHTVRVDYRFKEQHFITCSVSQALTDDVTRVYTRLYHLRSWKSPLVRQVLRWMTVRILEQDRRVVEPQARNAKGAAARTQLAVAADAPGIRVRRAYRAYYGGTWARSASSSVEYRL